MNVAAILRTKGANVVTARPNATITEVAKILHDANIGAVVISSDRVRVEGILSERDIVRAIADHGCDALTMTAADLMTRKLATCKPEDPVAQLMSVMTARRVRHLPVCEEGAMVGLVSIGDVVRVRVEEIEREAEALREYVAHG